jgi:hydroxymethylbilane synthase
MLLVGTRSSRLALRQTQEFLDLFTKNFPKEQFQIVPIKTTGDLITNKPLYEIGGKALFLKELEEKLINKNLDLAVHSLKDVPAFLPIGLTLASFLPRAASEDVLIANHNLFSLPKGSRIGSSSPRRKAFLANLLGDRINLVDIRGNIDTRINKFKEGEVDGLILAKAGLARLGLEGLIREVIPTDLLIPAIGQGVITIEIREKDLELGGRLTAINNFPTLIEVTAERAFMIKMDGNCKTPIAALARVSKDFISLDSAFALPDGSKIFRYQTSSQLGADPLITAEKLGLEAAIKIKEEIISSNFFDKVRYLFGAGDGNRTHAASLEG